MADKAALDKKTILILSANPSDTARLRLPEEVRKIQEGLALSEGRDRFRVESQWAVRPDDLRRALLKFEPQIVHFSGHGTGEQGLVFEDDVGLAKTVTGVSLARLFSLCPSVECVVLNACYSEVQASAIAEHVDYVVGMTKAIGDRAAIKFSVGFYDGLGYGRTIADAYEFGLSAIDSDGIAETDTPILQVRDGLTDGSFRRLVEGAIATNEPADEEKAPPANSRDIGFADEFDRDALSDEVIQQKVSPASLANSVIELEEPQGLVPLDSHFYIERSPIETDCYETVLRPGSLIRIKAPRQMGKTSLLVRTLDHAKSHGFETVRLSFQEADSQALNDLDEFLQWFCSSVTEELEMEDRLAEYWSGGRRGIVRRAQRYFERYLLTEIDGPIVLGLDEVDQVFEHPEIATDFFGMLRVWHEEGKSSDLWRKLHMVIVHSKEVYVPLSINRSPFNVGLPIDLRELDAREIARLIDRHQLMLSDHQKQQLTELVGGHPYLLRAALYQLKRGRMSLSQLMTEAPTEGGLYNDHLRRHLLNLEADRALLEAFRQVIQVYRPVQIGSTEAFKLNSMGLVKYQGNEVVPLCELYRQYFQSRLGG